MMSGSKTPLNDLANSHQRRLEGRYIKVLNELNVESWVAKRQ
jgi:hypothetical protein